MNNRLPLAGSFWENPFFVLALLAVLGGLIYANSLRVPFIYDDINNILLNPHVRVEKITPHSLSGILKGPSAKRPLSKLTFSLNYYFHRFDPAGYHLTNILIHIVTAFLVFLLAWQILRPEHQTNVRVPALAALLWLVNPLHTQSVTYTIQRMNSLAALFFLLSLICYATARRLQTVHPGNKRPALLFILSLISAILAMAAKPNTAILPAIILLYEWYFLQQRNWAWLKQKILWFAAILILFLLLAVFYLGPDPLQSILSPYSSLGFTLPQRLLTEPRVVIYYLSLLFFPHPDRLALLYDFPLSASLIRPVTTLIALTALFTLGIGGILAGRKHRLASFAVLWLLITLLIESSIIGLALIYEHRTYLPSVVLCIALTSGIFRFFKPQVLATGLLVGVIGVCGFWTWQRNHIWTERVGFWQDNAAKFPGRAEVRNNLGKALLDSGEPELARREFEKALALNPGNQSARLNLGAVLQKQGQTTAALGHYQRILQTRPNAVHNQARFNLAMILHDQGKTGQAIQQLQHIMQQDPWNDQAAYKLGLFYRQQQQLEKARDWFQKTAQLRPEDAEAYNSLGVTLREMGKPQEALAVLEKGLEKSEPHAHLLNTLGLVHLDLARYDAATRRFHQAIEQADNDTRILAAAWNNLGLTAEKTGQTETAIQYYDRALRVSPDYDMARGNLSRLLLKSGQPDRAIPLLRQLIEQKPGDAVAANLLATALTADGQLLEAIAALEKNTDQRPAAAITYYNLACLYARQGKIQTALDRLETALARGYDNWEQIRNDPDLSGVRQTGRYRQILEKSEAAGFRSE